MNIHIICNPVHKYIHYSFLSLQYRVIISCEATMSCRWLLLNQVDYTATSLHTKIKLFACCINWYVNARYHWDVILKHICLLDMLSCGWTFFPMSSEQWNTFLIKVESELCTCLVSWRHLVNVINGCCLGEQGLSTVAFWHHDAQRMTSKLLTYSQMSLLNSTGP